MPGVHGHQLVTHVAPGRVPPAHNPAGNALEFKAFADDAQVFAA